MAKAGIATFVSRDADNSRNIIQTAGWVQPTFVGNTASPNKGAPDCTVGVLTGLMESVTAWVNGILPVSSLKSPILTIGPVLVCELR